MKDVIRKERVSVKWMCKENSPPKNTYYINQEDI